MTYLAFAALLTLTTILVVKGVSIVYFWVIDTSASRL